MKRSGWRRLLAVGLAALGLHAAPLADDRPAAGSACPPAPLQPTADNVQRAAAAARDRGFLWRIERDGHSSWLYGTIHVGRFEWLFVGPTIRSALAGSRTIALELDISDPAIVQQLQQLSAGTPALPDPLRARLAAQAERACLPLEQLAGLHPVMQGLTYTLLDARWDDLHTAWAQEAVLAGFAKRTQRSIVSLETPQTQIDALIPQAPEEAARMLEQMLDQLEQGKARPVMQRLASAWERGDLEDLAAYEQWCDCIHTDEDRALMQRVQAGRNPGMADRIADLHREGEVFAAVGALHMTGDDGLPALLAARGFKVERVRFGAEKASAE